MDHPTPTSASKVGIVYGKVSGHVRRHIYVDSDDAFANHENALLPGEAICYVPIADHNAGHDVFHQSIRDNVQADGGVTAVLTTGEPGARMFAYVDPVTNLVSNIAMADPNIDQNLNNWVEHPLGTVDLGYSYNSTTKVFTNLNPPPIKATQP
jgi:hypothetical protein